jgi:hypothetical protein
LTGQVGKLVVGPDGVLQTADGKAEMLLTPGVFLRLDSNSAVIVLSPSLTKTTVELTQGKAMVEAAQVEKENHIAVIDHGANTWIEKHGIYGFNADSLMVAVYDGKTRVQEKDRAKDVGKGREVAIAQNPNPREQIFDRKKEDDLYAWSKLRSEYVSEANMASAQAIVVNGPGWWTGWYWNPWFDTWGFVPRDGFLYSLFGFGFYSPVYWRAYAPFYYRPGFGWYGRGARGPVAVGRDGSVGAVRGAAVGGFRAGLHGGPAMGGFHGGGFAGQR